MQKIKSNSVKAIKRASDWGLRRRSSLFSFRKKSTASQPAPDELDDLELIEGLVFELVDFNWDTFEFKKDKRYKKGRKKPSMRKSQFKELLIDSALKATDDDGEVKPIDDSDDESDNESVDSKADIHRTKSEHFLNQVSVDGKDKLRFIVQFARSGKKNRAATTLRDLTKHDRLKIRNSIHHAQMSKLYNGKRRSTILSKKSKPSLLARDVKKGSKLSIKPKKAKNDDSFAQMKGFKSKKHMERSYERLRGFEELRNHVHVNLMAENNGYSETGQKTFRPPPAYDSDEDEEDNEAQEFMELDDENLEDLLTKWGGDSKEDLDGSENQHLTKEQKLEKRKEMRQNIVKNGFTKKSREKQNEFVQYKLSPKDSLTSYHLDDIDVSKE